MSARRTPSRRAFALAAVACLLAAGARGVGVRAQGQPPPASEQFTGHVARGVDLYAKGEYKAAADAFKLATKADKTDPDAWHFLGLAYRQQGKLKDAREAFERSIGLAVAKLRLNLPASSVDEYERLSAQERRARRVRLAAGYERAAETVENYVRLRPEEADEWRDRIASLRAYAKGLAAQDGPDAIYFAPDVSVKAKMLRRPEPLYTEEARKNHVTGTVAVRMVLASDGSVRHIIVLKALPRGLTEMAVNAARLTQFVPAMKDGRPVSQYATVEYNFNIY